MATFMGKDVKKLRAKGGGKVSNFPCPRCSTTYHDLGHQTECGSILRILATYLATYFLIAKKKHLLNRNLAVEVHVGARHA